MDHGQPDSSVPGILQARTQEWVAIYVLNITGSDFHDWPRFSVDTVCFLFTCLWCESAHEQISSQRELKADEGRMGQKLKKKKKNEGRKTRNWENSIYFNIFWKLPQKKKFHYSVSEWVGLWVKECQCSMGTQFENHYSKSKVTCFSVHFPPPSPRIQTFLVTTSFQFSFKLDTGLKTKRHAAQPVLVKCNIHYCYPSLLNFFFPHSLTSNIKVLTKESRFGLKSPLGPGLKIWDNRETADPKRLGEKWRLESLRNSPLLWSSNHSPRWGIETADRQQRWGGTASEARGWLQAVLTSHIWSWKRRRSFSISSAISAPVISVRIIPCCLACSLFSFSILVL